MPSLKKLFNPKPGSTRNPYANPNHPTNIASSSFPTAAPTPFKVEPPQRPRSASPRASVDYLAEARQASGRDPVTGKRVAARAADPRGSVVAGASSGGGRGTAGGGAGAGAAGSVDQTSAYADRNRNVKRAQGTKYDLFVQEMKERERGAWREPDRGFYAPERRLGEFYAPEFYGPGGAR